MVLFGIIVTNIVTIFFSWGSSYAFDLNYQSLAKAE